MTELDGFCDPQFEAVRGLLAHHIDAGDEIGASLYASIDGEPVIDLWGGWRDRDRSTPWTEDTIVNLFSATKTVSSLAVLLLHERGELDLYAPVSDYWPEFAQNGKERAEVRHLISHSVGIPAWEPPFSIAQAMDVRAAAARLANQHPWWEPGEHASYHASSFGHLVGELVLRVTGRTLGRFIADELAGPLDADFYLGLDEEEFSRVATVYPAPEDDGQPPKTPQAALGIGDADDGLAFEREISRRTRLGSFSGQKRDPLALFNSPEWRRTELGGSSGHASARGLGRLMTLLSNGGESNGRQLLSPSTISHIFHEQYHGVDGYYMRPIHWGIGYALAPLHEMERGPLPFLRPGPRTCYWYGSGGALSIADVERGLIITYVMNQCRTGRASLNGTYYNAIYDCL